ncbi:MAG: hypothetical protein ACLP2P_16385, partial [Desulfobaccales bacterium]
MGIPGKKTWKSSLRHLSKAELKTLQDLQVYLWEELDAGVGNPKNSSEPLLREDVAADLPGLLVIPASKEFKDLSEAHCQGREIKPLVAELKKKARPPARAWREVIDGKISGRGKAMINFQPVDVCGKTIDHVWFQLLKQVLIYGRPYKKDEGSFAGEEMLELDRVSGTIFEPLQ